MAEAWAVAPDLRATTDIDRVTVEMAGHNVMVRSMATIDLNCTAALVDIVNAAAETGAVVVIDPESIPCEAARAASAQWASTVRCPDHERCRPADVEIAASGVIRAAGRTSWWTIDVATGRFCRSNEPIDCRFVSSAAWIPLVAVWITPEQLSALTTTGSVITGTRAHRSGAERAGSRDNGASRRLQPAQDC